LDHYIERGVPLRYRIRFKNTDPSRFTYSVVLTDTLSPHLDLSTFQLINSSHPSYQLTLNNRVLTIRFDGIWLPPLGQGFVDFHIQQHPNLPLGTRIENRAHIETRTSTVTNTTWHTINQNFIRVLEVPSVMRPSTPVRVTAFPNPFDQAITLSVEGGPDAPLSLEVYNVMGQQVDQRHYPKGANRFVFKRQQLPSGVYFYRLSALDQVLYTGRFIAQ